MLISRGRISCYVTCQTALALMTGCSGTISLVLTSKASSALRKVLCILSYCISELVK